MIKCPRFITRMPNIGITVCIISIWQKRFHSLKHQCHIVWSNMNVLVSNFDNKVSILDVKSTIMEAMFPTLM